MSTDICSSDVSRNVHLTLIGKKSFAFCVMKSKCFKLQLEFYLNHLSTGSTSESTFQSALSWCQNVHTIWINKGGFVLMKKTRYTDKFLLFTSDHPALNWVLGVNFKRTGIKMESKAKKCLQNYFIFKDSSNSLQIQSSNYKDCFVYKRQSFVCLLQASSAIRFLYNMPFS